MGATKKYQMEEAEREQRVEELATTVGVNLGDVDQISDIAGELLGLETELGKLAFRSLCEAAVLLDTKNRDYGPGNISAFGERGVIVRLNDKVERLKTLVWGGKYPEHEKVTDTWIDIANYGIIGLMCHRGDWK